MLSLFKVVPFEFKRSNGLYQELNHDDEAPVQGDIPLSTSQDVPDLNKPKFDILKLPSALAGEAKAKDHKSTFSFSSSPAKASHRRNRFYYFSRQPSPKKCEWIINNLKAVLNKTPKPFCPEEEDNFQIAKPPTTLYAAGLTRNDARKVSRHLQKPRDAKIIVSMLRKESHSSYGLQDANSSFLPPRGVCLRKNQPEFNSQSVSEDDFEDVIDVTKALSMRVPPPTEVIQLVTSVSVGKLISALGQSTGFFDVLAMGSKHLVEETKAHENLIGMVPKDRVSVWCYWWGFEIALPAPSIERLKQARSIETTVSQLLTILSVAGGMVEILPLINYLSTYFDIEWSAISAENKGEGVVVAATWALPMALIPRAWDFDRTTEK